MCIQVEDLKSLLEAYMRWHARLLPYYSYSQFVAKVEKLGANKRVRVCSFPLYSCISSSIVPVVLGSS